MVKIKNLDGGISKWKTSFILIVCLKSFMESKIIEYGKVLLHKYKVEQAEVIFRLLSTLLFTNYKNGWSDRVFTFS